MSIVLQGPALFVLVLSVKEILYQKKIKANFSPNITTVAIIIVYHNCCKLGFDESLITSNGKSGYIECDGEAI